MKFVGFVGTKGPTPPEAIEIMNSGFPAYLAEIGPRNVRVLGRELDFPQTAVTVRVRGGETLVSDGPFTETKEFVAGFDVLECVDMDEAIEVTAKNPVAQFHPFEIRPIRGELRLDPGAAAFGEMDDTAGIPYLLSSWADGPAADPVVADQYEIWRAELEQRGIFVLGGTFDEPQNFRTLRHRDGVLDVGTGSFLDTAAYFTGLDVIRCADSAAAAAVAATHPLASIHAIEVRPFYVE